MNLTGFVNGAYQLDNINADNQRCVNLYPEIIESQNGENGLNAYLKMTPGMTEILDIGTGPIRCVHYNVQGDFFHIISGNTLYKVTYTAGVWGSSAYGTTLNTSTGIVKAASGNLADSLTLFVDGGDVYMFWYTSSTEYFDELSTFGYTVPTDPSDITWIDGYFITALSGTGVFHVSDLDSPNFSAASFSLTRGNSDDVIAVIAVSRDLWVFGELSTEIFVNTGNTDFPFERVQSGYIDKGAASAGSVANIESHVLWLGRDEKGRGIVYINEGSHAKRISTNAIEQKINSYADMTTSVSYTYQENGHLFYVINFDEATWCYDITTGIWHERAHTNQTTGVIERHLAQCHFYHPEAGKHVVGHYNDGKVYVFDDSVYKDGSDYITRIRTTPYLSQENKNVFMKSLELEVEGGVGLSSGQGSDPQIMLDWSDDGGNNWSNEHWKSLGKIGEYAKRVIWRRLGRFRKRIFRFKITDPVKANLYNAFVEIDLGNS